MSLKIYAIKSKDSNQVYIGSTSKQYLSQRWATHIYDYRQYQLGHHKYVSSFQILKSPTAYIELLEVCKKEDRYGRERYWIENTSNCVNKQVPTQTNQEWVEKNKEDIREYKRNWMRVKRKSSSEIPHLLDC